MRLNARWPALAVGSFVFVLACGSSTSPSADHLVGAWFGRTAQGAVIAFNVSNDEKVTSITVSYSFNGCAGTQTFSDLNLETAPDITCIPGPCSGSVAAYRAFNYSSGRGLGQPSTTVNGSFMPTRTAEGSVGFHDFPECGSAIGVPWTAVRR
jgi:hypothetical protein